MNHHLLLKIFKGPEAVEKVLHPVRHMSFLITFLVTLSGQVVLNELFGPMKDMFACFLITFPFTVGLTALFVIMLNLDWQRVTGASIIVTIGLLTVFFWLLMFISQKLDLEQRGHHIREQQIREEIAGLQKELREELGIAEAKEATKPIVHLNVDSVLQEKVISDNGTATDPIGRNILSDSERQDLLKRVVDASTTLQDSLHTTEYQLKEMLLLSTKHPELKLDSNLKARAAELDNWKAELNRPDPWYMKIATIGPFIATLAYFRMAMGNGGFFSAIALAAFFAWYIQYFAVWLKEKKKKRI